MSGWVGGWVGESVVSLSDLSDQTDSQSTPNQILVILDVLRILDM